jgi:hypothetical protein
VLPGADGAFPMTNGHYLVTEINGDWADEMSPWTTEP